MNSLLQVSHLDFFIQKPDGKCQVLSDISFSIYKGEFIAIVGPTGCGKSTLASIISGILPIDSGTIKRNVHTIGCLVQKDNCCEWRSCHTDSNVVSETYGITAFNLLRDSCPQRCVRRRVELIKSLCLEPDLIILDETFKTLDYPIRMELGRFIRNNIRDCEKGGILVTTDLTEAITLCDRILIMRPYPGRICADFPVSH